HILEHLHNVFAGNEDVWLGEMGDVVYENRAVPLRDETGQVIGIIGVATDVTQRIKAEAALKESEARLQAIIDNSPAAIYLKDLQGRYLMYNRQGEAICRQSREQIIGRTDYELFGQELADRLSADDREVIASQIPLIREEELSVNDKVHTFISQKFSLKDALGVPYAVCGISTDITERKAAYKALQQLNEQLENRVTERTAQLEQKNQQLQNEIASRTRVQAELMRREQEFRALVENAPDLIARYDRQLRHLYVNPVVERVIGFLPQEIIGRTHRELGIIPEALVSVFERVIGKIFETGSPEEFSFSFDTPSGKRHYQCRLVPEFEADGTVCSVLAINCDITERKLAEDALRESEQRFRQVAENIHQAIWCTTANPAEVLYISPAYEAIWGQSCESLYQEPKTWFDAIHPEDKERVAAAVEQMSQPYLDVEFRIVRPDGQVRWIHDLGFPIRDEQGQLYRYVGIAEDITSRKLAETSLLATLEKERELSSLRSSFLSLVSHEFRTPLTTIQSSAELLSRYNERLSPEKKQAHHQRIQSALVRMTQLLDEVLLIGQAEAGKLKFEPRPMDLVPWCRDLVEGMQVAVDNACKGKNHQHANAGRSLCEIAFTSAGDCSEAQMDSKLLEHILTNLLSNAIKYSPEGGKVQFDLVCTGSIAVFSITDRGIGIPEEDQERLFESFSRASNVGTIQGTGLGLAIAKKAVDLHGGTISVESEVGVGTTFTVTLPLKLQSF
ncbi:MAG: PAS domain S-box protein, partial [Cyanobacteriota bacterium]